MFILKTTILVVLIITTSFVETESAKMRGVVGWFNNSKGYGFITPDDGSEDVLVYSSDIVSDGYKTLRAGERVEFEIQQGAKGVRASNVVKV